MTSTLEPCRRQLEGFVRRQLTSWGGLPARCVEGHIDGWLHFREGEAIARMGSEAVEYRVRVFESPGYGDPIRFFFRDETLAFLRTGMLSTDPTECRRLLRDLGDPQDRLDLLFDVGIIAGGEWIYGTRGLALGVIPDTGLIAAITGFPPTTVDEYRRLIRNARPAREFPAAGEP